MSRHRYMTHKQAAEYLGMDKRRLYRLVERRQVPFGKRGSALIYDKVRLDDWVDFCHKKHGTTMQEAVQRYLKKGNLL